MRDMLRRALRWFSAAAAPAELEIAVLKIHDLKYGITADLDDGLNAAIARGGWSQSPPNPLPGGLWGDVEEDIKIRLLTAGNSIYSSLAFMAQRVEELQSPLHPDYLNPAAQIALEARTPDEAASRWALLKELAVDKLDPAHYRSNGRSLLQITLTREGLWRGLEPGVSALTLRTYGIHVYTNGVQFANADIGTDGLLGDVEPLTIIRTRPFPGASHFNHIRIAIAHEDWRSAGTASDFDPWFWAKTIASGSPSLVFISTLGAPFAGMHILPGNECANLGVTSSFLWDVPASYFGYFTAYAVYQVETGGTMYFRHGITGNFEAGEPVTLYAGSPPYWNIQSLGTFRFPAVGSRIYGGGPANYKAGLEINIPSGKAILGGFFLVPQGSRTPQTVKGIAAGDVYANPITVANGELEQVYWTDTSGNPQIVSNGEIPTGHFQAPTPGAGVSNRFWFLPEPIDGAAYGALPDPFVDWHIGMEYIPRWKYLNQEGV